MIVFDCETEPFAPGLQFPPMVCGQFARGDRLTLVADRDVPDIIRAGAASGMSFLGHTIAYDFACAIVLDPELTPLVFDLYDDGRIIDLVVRQKLLDIAGGSGTKRPYGLSDLAQRYGHKALDKGADGYRTRFAELRHVPIDDWPERARAYALDDVRVCLPIFKAQEACDYTGDLLLDQHRQTTHAFWLKLMSGWGITTSPEGVAAFERAVRADHARVAEHLRKVGFLRPDKVLKSGPRKGQIEPGTRDTKAVKRRVAERTAHLPPDELKRKGYYTDTGELSTNKKVLGELGDPDLEAYAELSSLVKVLGTDVPLLRRGLIHSFFDSLKETGRIGSSDPNITNLPRKEGVRECFVPRAGCCYVSADYGGIELYTWAEVCLAKVGISTLADELKAGLDPHLVIASDITGKDYAWCLAHKKDVDLERQCGKVLNFGAPGGIGAERLAFAAKNQYGVDLPVARWKELRDAWWVKRIEMRPYSQWIASITDNGGVIEQLYSGRKRGGCSYTEGCNTLFQGLASDIAKTAGWLVTKACYVDRGSPLYGCRMVNFVHDEIILEVPIGRQHEAALELKRLMDQAAAIWLRLVPVPKIEVDAAMRWSKKVVALYDQGGRLVPWTRTNKTADGGKEHYGFVSGAEVLIRRDAA